MSCMPERECEATATLPPPLTDRQVYVHPGRLYFTIEPAVVTTILGSCVSVCLFDGQTGAAGMNHYLLPSKVGPGSTRFADIANEVLLGKFVEAGLAAAGLKAKVFGGASMGMVKSDLAARNISAAEEFLHRMQIPIAAMNVGGHRGRKLIFRTSDGAAWVRLL